MTTSREHVLAALNHEETDRVPIDLGSHASSTIAVMAYMRLETIAMSFRFLRQLLIQQTLLTLSLLLLPTLSLWADSRDYAPGDVEVPGYFEDRYADHDPESWYPARKQYTRKDYVDYVRDRAKWVRHGQDHGWYGPWTSLPALAVYAYESNMDTGDKAFARELAEGMMKTMRFYWQDIKKKADKNKYIMNLDGGSLCELIFSELDKRGDLNKEDQVLRKKMLLLHRKYTYQGGNEGNFFYPRGSHHRPQAIGFNHALAARTYPDEPGAKDWQIYADKTWDDWWKHRDVGINDNNYFYTSLQRVLIRAYMFNKHEIFSDTRAREILWDRNLYETASSGAVIPYGPHGGYNSFAGTRIFALESAATHSGDGTYKWAAHRIMDYGLQRSFSGNQTHYREFTVRGIALASLVCDDEIKAVAPKGKLKILQRPEIIRVSKAEARKKYPIAKALGASMDMTEQILPSKMIFRSGWEPGDMYLLVELFPRHAPVNPTAVMGMERYAASFAEAIYEKSLPLNNALTIEDLSRDATFLGVAKAGGSNRCPEGWTGMTTRVLEHSSHALASRGLVQVDKYQGYEATLKREFFFIDNRFVFVRDDVLFDDSFEARVGPIWNAQHVEFEENANWANTWWEQHFCSGQVVSNVPPIDLLVWHCPHEDRVISSKTWLAQSGTGERDMLKYSWTGQLEPGKRLQFAQVLLPHRPTRDMTALAESISVLKDTPGIAAVMLDGAARREIVLLNDTREVITISNEIIGTIKTDASAVYVDYVDNEIKRLLVIDGTILSIGEKTLFQSSTRENYEIVN